jgi:long-chain acyl-CoA synthetase
MRSHEPNKLGRAMTQPKTLPRLFEAKAFEHPTRPLIWEKRNGGYRSKTYGEIQEEIHAFAAGLLWLGAKPGDRIGLLSEGRKDWIVAELGILYTGAICVPLSVKLEEVEELRFRLTHSGTQLLVVSASQAAKAAALRRLMPGLQLIHLDGGQGEGVTPVESLLAGGRAGLEHSAAALKERWESIQESDPATISYTSGTTADPKGIVLTHRNYTANVEQCSKALDIPSSYRSLLILPWDHSFTHTAGIYLLIANSAAMAAVQTGKTYVETIRNIPGNIRELKPTFLFSVPALARNFQKNIESAVKQKGRLTELLFRLGLRTAYLYNLDGYTRGRGLRSLLKPLVALFDRLIFRKIREGFGGELKFFIGGGALLDIGPQRFFYALGIPMFQGYGLTEAGPVISANVPSLHRLGSSGMPIPDVEVKICDGEGQTLPSGQRGEIVVRGENVMAGYWQNERATREVLQDGWLSTGDLGYLDNEGFLYVLGRVKSLLISSDGEKYSPEGIEESLTTGSPYLEQVMIYNNQSPYTVALVVPSQTALREWLRKQETPGDESDAIVRALKLIEAEIMNYREGGRYAGKFPSKWLPVAFALLAEGFTEQNQLLNATLKMVRGRITERHRDRLNYLFSTEGKRIDNPQNRAAMQKQLFG